MSLNVVTLLYLVASVCFIQALKGLSNPKTARIGNTFGMAGMAIAILTTIALILKQAADCFHEPIRSRVQVGSFEALSRMVEGNIGIGILPEPAARKYAETMAIRILHLADDWASRTLHICVRDLEELPSFAADLVHRLVADAASVPEDSNGGSILN